MAVATEQAKPEPLKKTWGYISPEQKQDVQTLINKRVFLTESELVRRAVSDLILNHASYLEHS